MDVSELRLGRVVVDPEASGPACHAFFRVVSAKDPEIGPWTLERVYGGSRAVLNLLQVERLVAPQGPLAHFVGERVQVQLTYGGSLRGVLEVVRVHDIVLPEGTWHVAEELVIDGELCKTVNVESLEVL
jgi:hypothetical protein